MLLGVAGITTSTLLLTLTPGGVVNGVIFPPAIKYPPHDDPKKFFITASKYEDFVLSCEADRPDPSTTIGWRRSASQPLQSGWMNSDGTSGNFSLTVRLPKFTLQGSAPSFEGAYECFVNNSLGIAVSGPVTVKFGEFRNVDAVNKKTVPGYLGTTTIIPCSDTGMVNFYPSIVHLGYSVTWTLYKEIGKPKTGSPMITIANYLDPRIIMDEKGTLYIRNTSATDATDADSLYDCHIRSPFLSINGLSPGLFELQVLGTVNKVTAAKNVYKSQDLIARVGDTLYITCVFEDVSGYQPVKWTGPISNIETYQAGSMLRLPDVGIGHSGDWRCTYEGVKSTLTETIKVTVLEYPVLLPISDTYVVVGSNATVGCSTANRNFATFRWYWNGQPIMESSKWKIRVSQISIDLTIVNVSKSDVGVLACSATNTLGTMIANSRLIAYGTGSVDFTFMDSKLDTVSVFQGPFLLKCTYALDEMATQVEVLFRLQQRNDLINVLTNDPAFGLLPPTITINNNTSVSLTLMASDEVNRNIAGLCTCIVRYVVLDKQLEDVSRPLRIVLQQSSSAVATTPLFVDPGEFTALSQSTKPGVLSFSATGTTFLEKYWWIGVIVFSVAVIAVVLGVNMVYRRRRKQPYESSHPSGDHQAAIPSKPSNASHTAHFSNTSIHHPTAAKVSKQNSKAKSVGQRKSLETPSARFSQTSRKGRDNKK